MYTNLVNFLRRIESLTRHFLIRLKFWEKLQKLHHFVQRIVINQFQYNFNLFLRPANSKNIKNVNMIGTHYFWFFLSLRFIAGGAARGVAMKLTTIQVLLKLVQDLMKLTILENTRIICNLKFNSLSFDVLDHAIPWIDFHKNEKGTFFGSHGQTSL